MFDVSSYSNGFGVVFVPFVVGVVVRSILSALHAGGIRSQYLMVFIVCCLTFSPAAFAGTFTDNLDSIRQDGTTLYISQDSQEYYTLDSDTKNILISSFFDNEILTVSFDDATKEVETLTITGAADLYSKTVSLALGGLGCMAFCIGIGLKI